MLFYTLPSQCCPRNNAVRFEGNVNKGSECIVDGVGM